MAVSINNREDANKYYQQINLLVDDYIEKWKIRPKNLKSYLKPGTDRFNKFLKRNNLENVNGANVVLNDIINDRVSMESDGVLTFENYKLFESVEFRISSLKECLYKGIEKTTIKQEKILADYFDLNLGDIDIIDSHKHLFKIRDWQNDDWNVVIYSDEEVELIKTNICDHFFHEVSKYNIELIPSINVVLGTLVEYDKFMIVVENLIEAVKLNEIVATCLGADWSFEGSTSGHVIWVS